jgi:hypothetical protein
MASTWSPTCSAVGVAQHDDGQLVQRDLQNGQIAVRIGANHLGPRGAAVVEHHLDFVGTFHHVVIGQDVAGLADDDTTAQSFA